MNEFMRQSKGAISIFLIIVLLPMMTMAGVFIDLARSKLAQEVVVASADLAINTVLTDYDKDLKDYFGLIASCQDTDEVISVSKDYFKDSLISAGFDTNDAQTYVDNVVSAFIGDEDIQGHVDLDAPDMAVGHGLLELLHRKVFGVAPGVKFAVAQVHRVGAVLHSRPQRLHRPGRRK